jgi:hypothetical protein
VSVRGVETGCRGLGLRGIDQAPSPSYPLPQVAPQNLPHPQATRRILPHPCSTPPPEDAILALQLSVAWAAKLCSDLRVVRMVPT